MNWWPNDWSEKPTYVPSDSPKAAVARGFITVLIGIVTVAIVYILAAIM